MKMMRKLLAGAAAAASLATVPAAIATVATPATSSAVSPGNTTPTSSAASAKQNAAAIRYNHEPTASPMLVSRFSNTRRIVARCQHEHLRCRP